MSAIFGSKQKLLPQHPYEEEPLDNSSSDSDFSNGLQVTCTTQAHRAPNHRVKKKAMKMIMKVSNSEVATLFNMSLSINVGLLKMF